MAVFRLNDDLWFPDPHLGEDDGLVAVGGDLSVERLLLAYSNGFFPWFSFRNWDEPHWYCPMDRFVIFPDEIHVSHSMRQLINQQRYVVTINHDFEAVIRNCSTVAGRNDEYGAWLGPQMIEAYTNLHKLGYATSVEVWESKEASTSSVRHGSPHAPQQNGELQVCKIGESRKLVGGLYGVTIRNAFFGESMFSLVLSASKLALIYLAKTMQKNGGVLIDVQFETPHLRSMGGRYIPYEEYMKLLK